MNEQQYCEYLITLHYEKVNVMKDAIACAMITVATLLNELQILNFADKQITFWKKVYKLLDYEFRAYTENS